MCIDTIRLSPIVIKQMANITHRTFYNYFKALTLSNKLILNVHYIITPLQKKLFAESAIEIFKTHKQKCIKRRNSQLGIYYTRKQHEVNNNDNTQTE